MFRAVDSILEDIRLGLEINHPKFNQRRVSCVKFLGEMYNYQLIESNVVFRVLYLLISFGWNVDGACMRALYYPLTFRTITGTGWLKFCQHFE